IYLSLLVGLAIIAPLGVALAGNWRLIKPLALVPGHFTTVISELKSIGWMAAAWFVQSPNHSPLIIARLPLLNIVQDVLLIFGAYALWKAAKPKAGVLLAAMGLATLAAGLNDNIALLLLGLPAAGLLMATGLRYLDVEWLGGFPRRWAAKYLDFMLIAALGGVQVLYGVRYAIGAWQST